MVLGVFYSINTSAESFSFFINYFMLEAGINIVNAGRERTESSSVSTMLRSAKTHSGILRCAFLKVPAYNNAKTHAETFEVLSLERIPLVSQHYLNKLRRRVPE